MEVYLDRQGRLFTATDGRLVRVDGAHPLPERYAAEAVALEARPTMHFLKTPFHAAVYVRDGAVLETLACTPGDFYPGSPFDGFYAIDRFLLGERVLPRAYLYPTARCNCACPLCQFHGRHVTKAELSKLEMLRALELFGRYRGEITEQALVVSGDGEPLLYPAIRTLLNDAFGRNMRVFLTTNLTVPDRDGLYETMARCAMITVSVKGLTPDAYKKHQGSNHPSALEQTIRRLSELLGVREKLGRADALCVGVASLILPENTGAYCAFLDRAAALGVDYVYLNQIEPSPGQHGVFFTEEERHETIRELSEYAKNPHRNMIVRCSENPFGMRGDGTVYFDAANGRENREVCGSALFNPLALAMPNGRAVFLACRNGDLFDDTTFAFTVNGGRFGEASERRVMKAARDCRTCRLERQVRRMDRMLTLAKRYGRDCEHLLVFDLDKLAARAYAVTAFESVVG